jgi:hypothetical protein
VVLAEAPLLSNLTSLGVPAQQSTFSTTGKNNTGSGTGTCDAVSCPVGKGTVIRGVGGIVFRRNDNCRFAGTVSC